jgi:hypothetical protein
MLSNTEIAIYIFVQKELLLLRYNKAYMDLKWYNCFHGNRLESHPKSRTPIESSWNRLLRRMSELNRGLVRGEL